MHYRIYSQYHIMREKSFLGTHCLFGHLCSPNSLGRHWQNNQLITNVMTTVWPMTLDFRYKSGLKCPKFKNSTQIKVIILRHDMEFPTIWNFDKFRNSKWWSVSSVRVIEYSSDQLRLPSDCAYAQAGLRLCWSHISHCWKSQVAVQILMLIL